MGRDRIRNGVAGHPARPVKAYRNPEFLESRNARMVRIMCEYLEPLSRLSKLKIYDTVVMFGSSRARPMAEARPEYDRAVAQLRESRGSRKDFEAKVEKLRGDVELARYYEEAAELSERLSRWAKTIGPGRRFVVASGGGPGIMEAANRGATERAGWISAGYSISLPMEEKPNRFISPELAFEFHYFFMRKFWFVYLASAVVIFPGGYGTMDELFEVLTLCYTRKIHRPLPLILYGRKYWDEVINFKAMVKWGVISPEALNLFHVCDTPDEAFAYLKGELLRHYRRPSLRAAP
ncbi:MAG TPA: LOG family protein [Planctomycetota bacterium]|nr:LOG family protein [Planctomycetota bacterium]